MVATVGELNSRTGTGGMSPAIGEPELMVAGDLSEAGELEEELGALGAAHPATQTLAASAST